MSHIKDSKNFLDEKSSFQLKLSKQRKERWREWAKNEGISLSEAVREAMRRMIDGELSRPKTVFRLDDIFSYLDDKFSQLYSLIDQQFSAYIRQIQTEREEQVREQTNVGFSLIEREEKTIQHVANRIIAVLENQEFQKPDQIIRTIFAGLFNKAIERLEKRGKIGQDRGGSLFLIEEEK